MLLTFKPDIVAFAETCISNDDSPIYFPVNTIKLYPNKFYYIEWSQGCL